MLRQSRVIALALASIVLGSTLTATAAPPAVATDAVEVEQWVAHEFELGASNTYTDPLAVDVTASFAGPGGAVITRPAFWDGGTTWKVRFAPTEVGRWTMTVSSPSDVGLNGSTAVVDAVAYEGDKEIYQRGFVRPDSSGRYFEYADGTPFFYLGDTHWIMPHERFDSSNADGVASQFKYVVDKRVEQGFTVYQSEPIWQPHVVDGLSAHDRSDEETVADLSNGFAADDLPGFAALDRKFQYIADAGLVHANAEVTWVNDPRDFAGVLDASYMYDLTRYWVARYGAFPVMWTIAQEIDKDGYGNLGQDALDAWAAVGQSTADNDAYNQVIMPHMEAAANTTASNSSWKDKPFHDAFAAQINIFQTPLEAWNPVARDFWTSSPAKPTLLYEGAYQGFWTDAVGGLSQGYRAFQSGMYGYGYGISGLWNDIYSKPGEPMDAGTDYELDNPDRHTWWFDAANDPVADQLTIMKDFFTSRGWWKYEPRFDDPQWSGLPSGAYLATDGNKSYTAFYSGSGTASGDIRNLDPAAVYTAAWFNPRNGVSTAIGEVRSNLSGTWAPPTRPDGQDWLLTVDRARTELPSGNLALNATATASSARPGQGPEAAVDGDLSTNWQACEWCWQNEWIEVELDSPQAVNHLLVTEWNNRTRAYRVEYWNNGAWNVALEGTGGFGNRQPTILSFPARTSDRFRLVYLEGIEQSPIVYELGLYYEEPNYPTGNIARDGTYAASSTYASWFAPQFAFDGNPNTAWQACSGCWNGEWLEVDFGEDRKFDAVTLSEYGSRTQSFVIEYWFDGQWIAAFAGLGPIGEMGESATYTFSPVVGSKARVRFLAGLPTSPIIYEFEVLNSGQTSATSVDVGN